MDILAGVDELTSEKRSAKRESNLRKIFKGLTQYATGESGTITISNKYIDICTVCFYGLRNGAAAEQYAACRVLEATSVILGSDQDEYYEHIQETLRRIIMTTSASRATPVRIAALRALSMANFICTSDQETTENLLDLCEEVANVEYRNERVPTTLRAAALDCWGLLATTLPNHYLAGQDDVTIGRGLAILQLLKDCLDTSCVELRSASGECIALIHEARLALGLAEDEGENTTERKYARGSWENSDFEVLMDEVKQRIAELSTESGYHLSKKVKKEQRATFREFVTTIVDDEAPEEVVSFRGGNITLNSWEEIIQLNFIRHCLQGGFQIQVMTNATLQAIFGANGSVLNALENMSSLEKRLVMSKTSEQAKLADQDMTKKRRVRNNVKNHFLTADGDDL